MKAKETGKPISGYGMTEERILKLEKLGFRWNIRGKWHERLEELK